MNETTVVTNIVSSKDHLKYQYNPVTKQLLVKSESTDSVKLFSMQGICMKQIIPNVTTQLTGLPTGSYIILSAGVQPEKISIY